MRRVLAALAFITPTTLALGLATLDCSGGTDENDAGQDAKTNADAIDERVQSGPIVKDKGPPCVPRDPKRPIDAGSDAPPDPSASCSGIANNGTCTLYDAGYFCTVWVCENVICPEGTTCTTLGSLPTQVACYRN